MRLWHDVNALSGLGCYIARGAGCEFVRQGKGSHEIRHSPITNKNFSVPFMIKSKPTANGILKQAGINTKI